MPLRWRKAPSRVPNTALWLSLWRAAGPPDALPFFLTAFRSLAGAVHTARRAPLPTSAPRSFVRSSWLNFDASTPGDSLNNVAHGQVGPAEHGHGRDHQLQVARDLGGVHHCRAPSQSSTCWSTRTNGWELWTSSRMPSNIQDGSYVT